MGGTSGPSGSVAGSGGGSTAQQPSPQVNQSQFQALQQAFGGINPGGTNQGGVNPGGTMQGGTSGSKGPTGGVTNTISGGNPPNQIQGAGGQAPGVMPMTPQAGPGTTPMQNPDIGTYGTGPGTLPNPDIGTYGTGPQSSPTGSGSTSLIGGGIGTPYWQQQYQQNPGNVQNMYSPQAANQLGQFYPGQQIFPGVQGSGTGTNSGTPAAGGKGPGVNPGGAGQIVGQSAGSAVG